MPPEQELEAIIEAVRTIIASIEQISASGEEIDDETAQAISNTLSAATQRIQQLDQEIAQGGQGAPPTPQVPVPEIARELWTLARGDVDVFRLYMQSYPNPQVNSIAGNPTQMDNLMNQINNTQNVTPRGNADGIEQAPLQSSNVYGFRYDPLQKRLTVRFNQGSVYRYEGVPKVIFDMFSHGDGVARTTGRNRWGRWWRGKNPSLGASLNQLIKLGGFPYARIR